MKIAFFALAGLCIFAIATRGQKQPRVIYLPTYIYKAETFLDFDENNKIMYTSGIVDGFFASTFFGATDETVATLKACLKDMDTKQLAAILTKYVKDHPEAWQHPMSVESYNALGNACPGVLKTV
jgi:hypothetical protein